MLGNSLKGLEQKKLRLWLALFFLALAIPTAILIHQAYRQIKWEAFHQHRQLAEELAARIDGRFIQLINDEEARSFSDYAFLVVAGDPAANFLQRSPLSAYPVESTLPGLIGYFQVDAQGTLSTPLLPQLGTDPIAYGISNEEFTKRQALHSQIQRILGENRLVQSGPPASAGGMTTVTGARPRRDKQSTLVASEANAVMETAEQYSTDDAGVAISEAPSEEQLLGQAAFDRLNKEHAQRDHKKKQKAASTLGRVEDLKLDYRYQDAPADEIQRKVTPQNAPLAQKRSARKERSVLPEAQVADLAATLETETPEESRIRIRTFESEIDPFELSLLDSGHFVLFRKVWRDGQRFIQGALIEQQPLLQSVIKSAFNHTALSHMSDLIVAYQGNVSAAFTGQTARGYRSSAAELRGALLYQTRLSVPFNHLELIFSITQLPAGPSGKLITWVAAILVLVLSGGFYLMYRLGVGQINLARQQQDFVSAVSHELKTPLTSIRMYGEMLREGWASDDKKKVYCEYIHDESERLSRLIANVLQLARMTRNDLQVDLKDVTVTELMDGIRSKITSQIERAGFELRLRCEDETAKAIIQVDDDYFTQIIINLVDNAIKFSSKTEPKVIDITCQLLRGSIVQFSVRDHGPGIPNDQMKKIFKLFYRSENELTRETVGTGIGLALVHQLAQAMDGKVDVVNKEPGAEFGVSFSIN